jgi:FtsZ-binding cell division protein ZapB
MAPPKKLGTDIRALTEKIHLLQIQIDDLKARVDALTSEANLNGIGMGALI